MSTIGEKFGTWFSAIAFAEAGEHNTALQMVGLPPVESAQTVNVLETFRTSFAAAAFAEENCQDVARQILDPTPRKQTFAEVVGLKGVRVRYGRVSFGEESFLETLGISGVKMRLGVVSL